jgi:hypothetical protein
MDPVKPATTEPSSPRAEPKKGSGGRRRWEMTSADVRYFLIKPGTNTDRPELGREVTYEADALVEAFRKDQPFYTLVAWKAVSENDDGGGPRIVKEAIKRT